MAVAAIMLIALSVWMLEQGRAGLTLTEVMVGTTPATLYRKPGEDGPVVVVARGFAGSRPIMQAYSLSLAQAGYRVLAFDFQGHGRNPVPMSGDVTRIDGTTALLVAETRRVIAQARAISGPGRGVAVLGHSMATDILVRASDAEAAAGTPLTAVVAVSMFSQAVTATTPPRLLVVSGAYEAMLRAGALDAVRLVDPAAREGQTVTAAAVTRRAVVAPGVEHVGVLFSATAVRAARDWMDAAFGRTSTAPLVVPGGWVLALLAGIVALVRPLVAMVPATAVSVPQPPPWRFAVAVLVPALVVPLVLPPLYQRFLPVLVADYLLLHLALFGAIQLALLRPWLRGAGVRSWPLVVALLVWGICVFGLALDRYAASFWPTADRLVIIAALAFGTVPAMLADSLVTGAGRGALWRRVVARVGLLGSIGAAAALDPDRLIFLVIILPVLALFFLVYGLMGRWVAQRSGAMAAGLGLGLVLAWTLGVSFPLFVSG